jgi:hypothetical protein
MPRAAFTFFCCLVLLAWTGSAIAAEPVIDFPVEDGFILIQIRNDDGTGAQATLEMNDAGGNVIAMGETAEDGSTAFPLPTPGRYWLFVTIGKKKYDVIQLRTTKTTVEPPRVLLSVRLYACCRAPAVPREGTGASLAASSEVAPGHWLSDWLLAGLAGSGCVAAAGTLLVFRRRGLRPASDPVSTSDSQQP